MPDAPSDGSSDARSDAPSEQPDVSLAARSDARSDALSEQPDARSEQPDVSLAARSEQQARTGRIGAAAALLALVALTMAIGLVIWVPGGDGDGGTITPVGAGVTRTVTSAAEWDAAVQAAQPGDEIRITATINARLVYRGSGDGGSPVGADGTESDPIVITAEPGAWIDPGDQASSQGALDVLGANHVHVVGVQVRNAQFGIRCQQCGGTPANPVRIASNTVTDIGHAGIHISGHWLDHDPSHDVLVEGNQVTRTGRLAARYGEGVYVGYGETEWIDVTAGVTIRNNEIWDVGAEGVDVKPGTRDVVVENNLIHDLAPIDGGAISAHYVNAVPNPHPSQLDQVIVRGNRIWNQNLAGVSGSNDWAIWVGHGGVEVRDNTIWGLRDTSGTRAVRVRATQDFGPHQIVIADNTFWTSKGWVAEGVPSGASNVVASGNRGPDAASNEVPVDASAFVGPVPALGVSSTADAGSGPGTAFSLAGASTTTTAAAPTTTTAPSPDPVEIHPATTVFGGGAGPVAGSEPVADPVGEDGDPVAVPAEQDDEPAHPAGSDGDDADRRSDGDAGGLGDGDAGESSIAGGGGSDDGDAGGLGDGGGGESSSAGGGGLDDGDAGGFGDGGVDGRAGGSSGGGAGGGTGGEVGSVGAETAGASTDGGGSVASTGNSDETAGPVPQGGTGGQRVLAIGIVALVAAVSTAAIGLRSLTGRARR
jgi:hypothetical protein